VGARRAPPAARAAALETISLNGTRGSRAWTRSDARASVTRRVSIRADRIIRVLPVWPSRCAVRGRVSGGDGRIARAFAATRRHGELPDDRPGRALFRPAYAGGDSHRYVSPG
jgi:hypothetical protein